MEEFSHLMRIKQIRMLQNKEECQQFKIQIKLIKYK
jgi:hypothetical protein